MYPFFFKTGSFCAALHFSDARLAPPIPSDAIVPSIARGVRVKLLSYRKRSQLEVRK
jgi:hypothetical protein